MELTPVHKLAIALGLGLLVGMQREWADKSFGIRTFPLITVFGSLTALLADRYGGYGLAAALLGLTGLLVVNHITGAKSPDRHRRGDITTEVAALVMFGVGAAVMADFVVPALIVGGGVAVLLQWKRPMHEFVDRVGESDIRAILRFVLIALVILPALPDQGWGPDGVLNPFEIWQMVVLIVGISLLAYVGHKIVGPRAGTALAAVLGGLISSTATTLSQAKLARSDGVGVRTAASFVIIAATAIMFGRILIEVAFVARSVLPVVAAPLGIIMGITVVAALIAFAMIERTAAEPTEPEAPTGLLTPIFLGLLYAGVLFGVAMAKKHLGIEALYAVAALSGLTDVDAITLSTATMIESGRVEAKLGWRLIVVGAMANLVFKVLAVLMIGRWRLFVRVTLFFLPVMVGSLALVFLWPD